MAYYFYFLSPNPANTYLSEDNQSLCSQVDSSSVYPAAKIFMAPTFMNSQVTFGDFACYPSQQEFVIPTYSQLSQVPEVQQVKQSKKRQRNCEKQIQSAKKNSESNLINHFFSFFNSRQKSEKIVQASISSLIKQDSHKEKLLHLFYNTVHVVNQRRGRKYVNRKILLSMFETEELLKAVPEIKEKILKISEITVDQLCEVFRKCCYSFYRTYSIDSILTSKRISSVAKEEHFRKRRKVLKIFVQKAEKE